MAMLLTLLVLVAMSAIAVSAIERSGEESAVSGRARRSARAFHAADGGVQVALRRLFQSPPQTAAFSFTTTDGTLYRTGVRSDPSPQDIEEVGDAPPPDGFSICVDDGCFHTGLFRAEISAFAPDGSSAELEAQIGILETN
jgi:type II secretory pathway component PulK